MKPDPVATGCTDTAVWTLSQAAGQKAHQPGRRGNRARNGGIPVGDFQSSTAAPLKTHTTTVTGQLNNP
jgi:hypothetical protein